MRKYHWNKAPVSTGHGHRYTEALHNGGKGNFLKARGNWSEQITALDEDAHRLTKREREREREFIGANIKQFHTN